MNVALISNDVPDLKRTANEFGKAALIVAM